MEAGSGGEIDKGSISIVGAGLVGFVKGYAISVLCRVCDILK